MKYKNKMLRNERQAEYQKTLLAIASHGFVRS
jgi:hypothetical protein